MKTPTTRLMLALALALVAVTTLAREISSAEAGKAAAAWVRRDSAPLGANLSATDAEEVLTTRDGETPIFHVVRLSGGGVVVTSAESGVTPVVAFFDGDAPTEGDGNPLWEILTADMAERTKLVGAVREAASSATTGGTKRMLLGASAGAAAEPFAAEESAWAALLAEDAKPSRLLKAASVPDASGLSDLRVAPLLSTTWGQEGNAANYYTPPGSAGDPTNYRCGCVALAGAQIANYWRFPTESMPQVDRLCRVDGVACTNRTMGGTYDWQNMPSDFSSLTEDQKQAVGKLCYDLGVATYMKWGADGSGTPIAELLFAFRDVFGYANAVAHCALDDVGNISDDNIERAILANLDAKAPVALGIDGHAVVADGYGYVSGTLYTHLNLGWDGLANAWYNLPDVDATAYGDDYTSSVLSAVVYNIHPTETGDLLTGRVLDENGEPVAGATVVATSGSDTANAVTDEKGIYALRVAGGKTWSVSATSGAMHGSCWANVAISNLPIFAFDVAIAIGVYYEGLIGNSWGNDITLGVENHPMSLADALDAPALTFTSGGVAGWLGDTAETYDGDDAARSGLTAGAKDNWMETTVYGPGTISFWWNVSSEEDCDWLEFYVDGALDSRISGTNTTWTQKSVEVSGGGNHTLRWRYFKDECTSAGEDCGWVDQVVWTQTTFSSYTDWAAASGVTGAWNEKSGGVYNVFRYVFGVPSGAFEDPPLIDIELGNDAVLVKTPPVVNSAGATVSVVESSDVAGETMTATKAVDATGKTEFTKGAAASRFYRLSATMSE